MTPISPGPTIIVIKKKKGGHGHHGGAWKVAYADFVTAMMALFIVLWLLSSSEDVKKAIGGYFQDPTGNGKQVGSTQFGSGEALAVKKDDMPKLKEKLQAALQEVTVSPALMAHVQMTVTNEGLRIELIENEAGLFFESGKPKPTDKGTTLISALATEVAKLPNRLLIEGHTDSKPYSGDGTYSNWDLSTDRANAARRIMEANGLRPNQVAQIRGFADQSLKNPANPEDASNRRISVVVQYINAGIPPKAGAKPAAAGKQAAAPTAAVASLTGAKVH